MRTKPNIKKFTNVISQSFENGDVAVIILYLRIINDM